MLSLKVKDLRNRKAFHLLEKSRIVNKFLFINVLSKNSVSPLNAVTFFSTRNLRVQSGAVLFNICDIIDSYKSIIFYHVFRPFFTLFEKMASGRKEKN